MSFEFFRPAARARCLLLVAASLSGCTLAPRYQRPASSVADQWPDSAQVPPGDARVPAADLVWQDFFGDAKLREIIQLALENNRDLRIAMLNVEQAAAVYGIQRYALIPTVDATGSLTRQRTPAGLSPSGTAETTTVYRVGLASTGYELDLFGRIRSLRDQALAEYFATDEARKSAHISLISAVATQYLALFSLDEQLQLARQTYAAIEESHVISQRGYDIGSVSELDFRSSEAQLQAARATIAAAARQRTEAENALAVLVGQALPAGFERSSGLEHQRLVADLPAGLPSDLLQRRPDIRSAEQRLKAANANIGVARAAFFPAITLTAFGGSASTELDGLFASGSNMWSFVPDVTLPIFAAGVNRATLDIAKLGKQVEIANYERTIQRAFQEVADALAAQSTLEEQLAAQTARVAAEQRRYELSELRYRRGADSYVAVLLAHQDLFSAQQGLIEIRFARLANQIALYKALGGGWTEEAAEAGSAAAAPSTRASPPNPGQDTLVSVSDSP